MTHYYKFSTTYLGLLFAAVLLISPLGTRAQKSEAAQQHHHVSVHLQPSDTAGIKLSLHPMGQASQQSEMSVRRGLVAEQDVAISATGLYELVVMSTERQMQLTAPLYFAEQLPTDINLSIEHGCPRVTVSTRSSKKQDRKTAEKQNEQLEAIYIYNKVYYQQSHEVWAKALTMTADELRAHLRTYDDALKQFNQVADEPLRVYADVWTYLLKQECISIYNRYHNDARLNMAQEIGPAHAKLDNPTALLFNGATVAATQDMPKGSLTERLQYANTHYQCPGMRENIHQMIADSYIRRYKFDSGYQEGLTKLQEAVNDYGLNPKFIDRFKERIAAVPGASFPQVDFIDAEGNKVSFEQFRGKYVYIDLWASWCVPCCREVPHLQALEQEVKNPDVAFLSISIDSTEKPWRERMEQLKMHGHQWLNVSEDLCDRLNVSSIPHFLIYDKEGKLHTYNAPRPSHKRELMEILEGLK